MVGMAALRGHVRARERSLRWLIAAGAALGSVDNAGSTPLIAAAAAGQAASVSLLASAGADADATRADGRVFNFRGGGAAGSTCLS
ncbi:hypothetical protein EMIHUDRAFT_208457 [Emiliania huxleyi CCMP1516]|uniref:Ankyrin repeat domain-containing protein n=2 Tax=Emiliania huxleyi TaxID=2903 RepID=A0A0D3JAK7_EMIH1|nr:hypothetical protein EMIHUDRAFT_208457 [Emiliania huxleyi CCMP1516]EOD20542.1 hypothetical protein EMIHUDRAFT_208457 [Emiliania huxleyi CCMP1516]|eukprot:XP_005772971.1 hypothetical protein EMIHUDRAFT_208457 [Emiliania huxleyi CCMP1516]